jgi:ABC-2 type transport system permease protein
MKDFFIVLKFELLNVIKNKAFIISTVIICVLIFGGLSVPTIKDQFFSSSTNDEVTEEAIKYGFVNNDLSEVNTEDYISSFSQGELIQFDSEDQLKEKINNGEIKFGAIINSSKNYDYVVNNNDMSNNQQFFFEEALIKTFRIKELNQLGLEYVDVEELFTMPIESNTIVLGKDSAQNFLYTYILVFGLYFMIIVYGQLIASGVASEKSNRSMEVLITSAKSSNLIFGKVLGGALAGALQFAVFIGAGFIAYKINAAAWDNSLDFIFNIPASVLLTFSVFGILGYLLYAFIFGALGALVSRTEDISASSTPITILFVVVFIISMTGMQNPEGLILKVASFVPFSSFMSMFVRVSMGNVSNLEIAISLIILVITTIAIGFLAAIIYRMGTLMYGNRVKLKDIFKLIKAEKN